MLGQLHTIRIGLIVLTLVGFASDSYATDLETALALEAQGRLGEALTAFEQVLQSEGNSREQLATIYQHLGLLRLASNDREGARQAMRRLLTISDDVSLPGTAPPELNTMLAEAREERADRQLDMELDVLGQEEQTVALQIDVRHDIVGMVAGAALLVGGQTIAEARGQPPYRLDVETEGIAEEGHLVAQLVDEHGGVLVEHTVPPMTFTPTEEEPAGEGEYDAQSRSPCTGCRVSGWTLAIGGLLALGGGIPLIIIDGDATGETRLVDGRQQREEYTTSIGGWTMIGVGAAALITGIVLLIVERRRAITVPRAEHLSLIGVAR